MDRFKSLIGYHILWAAICFQSCHDSLKTALEESKNNRCELEQLLQHYEEDEMKLAAAKFLIENMDAHGCYRSSASDSLYQNMENLFKVYANKNANFHRKGCDSLYYSYWRDRTEYEYCPDINHLTAEYLIAQIDDAFDTWQTYWKDSYSFEHFCNYVLPYRIGKEPLSDWRTEYLFQFKEYLDKYPNRQNNLFQMYGVCSLLNKRLSVAAYNFPTYAPDLPLSLLTSMTIGDCHSYATRNVALFRALGLPAAYDFVPQWGNRSKGHAWSVFLPTDAMSFPFGTKEGIGEHLFYHSDNKIPKVFRKTFVKQKWMNDIYNSNDTIPELFQTQCLQDVTSDYIKTYDITVPLFPTIESQWVYLAVFNDSEWEIVHYGKNKNNQGHFTDMGSGIVYLPVIYDKLKRTIPAGHPFILHENGNIQMLVADKVLKEKVRLVRKYRTTKHLKDYYNSVLGGKFQVADNKDFNDAVTIAIIDSLNGFHYQELPVEHEKPCKFFRFLTPEKTNVDMAEIEMYDRSNNKLVPKCVFNSGRNVLDGMFGNNIQQMFDDNVLTYYSNHSNKKAWIGVEFEEPVHLTKVRYLPRNDDNFIREGETYQLFYWDSEGWKLIKTLKGNREGVLLIDEVPKGALLWLRNRTKGNEERIFTYEDGKQVWW